VGGVAEVRLSSSVLAGTNTAQITVVGKRTWFQNGYVDIGMNTTLGTAGSLYLSGSGKIHLGAASFSVPREAMGTRFSETTLTLNGAQHFRDGVYTPGMLQVEGGLWIGNSGGAPGANNVFVGGITGLGGQPIASQRLRIHSTGTGTTHYPLAIVDPTGSNSWLLIRGNNSSSTVYAFVAAGAWNYSSDARLKRNIEPISRAEALAAHRALRATTFFYKGTKRLSSGFIAQDIQTIPALRHLVSTNEDGMLTLQTEGLISYQTVVIQDLEDRVTSQGATICALEERLAYLEAMITKGG
jgi:hypothetical protein